MALFHKTVAEYRSSWYEIARNLLRSRDTQRERVAQLQEQLQAERKINEQLRLEQQQVTERCQRLEQENEELQTDVQRLLARPVVLPPDPPLPQHSYGARMISLCIQLAKKVGLRASSKVLQIVFDWLSIATPVPCTSSIRTWLCRMGVDEINDAREMHDDWIWMVDHSNQSGQEKVLTILGIRASKLPPPGQTLRHEDVQTLAVIPGKQWKREDVGRQYEALANKIGIPRMILTDGAVELRESVQVLEKDGKKPILLRDLKHFAANELERIIGHSESFKRFSSLLGSTRSSIQQTELSHFTPPTQKSKARFMNLAATLRWAEMVLWHLDHPSSVARQQIDVERMNSKLGWMIEFRQEITQWRQIEKVIDDVLGFINKHGLYAGAADALKLHLDDLRSDHHQTCALSDQMKETLVNFVLTSEKQLDGEERGWLSTEILESAFGLYKTLEGQQSKGGFTSLLASFGALLKPCTPEEVRKSLGRTRVNDVKHWVATSLGKTLASKKAAAYRRTLVPAPGS
jgi:hypothetical protein